MELKNEKEVIELILKNIKISTTPLERDEHFRVIEGKNIQFFCIECGKTMKRYEVVPHVMKHLEE
jgi:hypothetical protein